MNEVMNETELRTEETRLDEIIKKGEATVAQANRLDKIRHYLKRIESVKYGKTW